MSIAPLREHARAIWDAAVRAADPFRLVHDALTRPEPVLAAALTEARRVLVVGGGKAGVAMARAAEEALNDTVPELAGVVNVPAPPAAPLRKVRLHDARTAGTNQPTPEGVAGVDEILRLAAGARPGDLCLCLLSGGGSALLPAPVEGVSLADKQHVTRLLHACGATIDEMNCVRKHLSRIKGGRLAQTFLGDAPGTASRQIVSLIVSDVIGDPLDVIASGPTAADPTTFADALAVLDRFGLLERTPASVRAHLERGRNGLVAETLKVLPAQVHNLVLGNNRRALDSARRRAQELGYGVLDLGSFLDGETSGLAVSLGGLVRSIRRDGVPLRPPACVLSGGETTVTLTADHGRGGRNQEFVLALAHKLGRAGLDSVVVLSGGTDGEDGPTDAAGAVADAGTLDRAVRLGLAPADFLRRHDAYTFFEATGDLLKTGLTQTNVMDVRVVLLGVQ
jgi:hydroxypyruvate reductase/glycerate 2-kinase